MSLYFITGNDFKFERAQERLSAYGIAIQQKELDIPEIQSGSLEKIVLDKARRTFEKIGEPVLVMDAGLFIKKYNGFPGPYTSYIEKTLGLDGLIKLIGSPTEARIEQVVAYKDKDYERTFRSGQEGTLLAEKRGQEGYFFDYIFESDKNGKTIAEMNRKEKSKAWGNRWDQFGKWFNTLA